MFLRTYCLRFYHQEERTSDHNRRVNPLQCHHLSRTLQILKLTALNIRGLCHYCSAICTPCACQPNASADDFDVWQNVGRMGTETEVPCHIQASCAVTGSSCTGSSCHTVDIGKIHWILILCFYLQLFAAATRQMVQEAHLAICSISRYLNLKQIYAVNTTIIRICLYSFMSIPTYFIIALMTSFNIPWAGKSDHYIHTVNLEVYIIMHKSIVQLTKMAFLRVHLKYQVLQDIYCSMSKITNEKTFSLI